jgi:hypothetical protein
MSDAIAISTYSSHVQRAFLTYMDIKNKTNGLTLFGIGRSTSWSNETEPPLPLLDTKNLEETIGYKNIEQSFFVVPSANDGIISFDNMRWNKVVPIDTLDGVEARRIYGQDVSDDLILFQSAKRLNSRWLYLSTSIKFSDFSTSGASSYRQIGIFSNIILKDGVSLSDNYIPDQIRDGSPVLEVYKNRSPVFRNPGQIDKISMIIEF